jgi:4-alpha-glucanotransferase
LNDEAQNETWNLIRLAWSSVAVFAIAPMQDILNLGVSARMNVPGSVEGNWAWKMNQRSLKGETSDHLAEITQLYGR